MLIVDEAISWPTVAPILISIAKAWIASDALWAAASTSVKISIVHFLIAIFRSNIRFLRTAYAVIVLVSAFGVSLILIDVLACRPLSKIWHPLEPGVCVKTLPYLIAISSCNMAIDLIILLLPMPMIWGIQMATRRKIELTVIFALGFMYASQSTPFLVKLSSI